MKEISIATRSGGHVSFQYMSGHDNASVEDERERVLSGCVPRLPEWVLLSDIEGTMNGNRDDSHSVVCKLHDFQRFPFALHLASLQAPKSSIQVIVEDALTQSHCFRILHEDEIEALLKYADFPIPVDISDPVTLYRGGNPSGLSWSLSRDVAIWFANSKDETEIHEVTVPKSYIAFYSNSREEQEVLIWPSKVNTVAKASTKHQK